MFFSDLSFLKYLVIEMIYFLFKGDVINVVLEVISVEIVVKINEVTKQLAMDIGKLSVER